MSVQFDDDENFAARRFAIQSGHGPDAIPQVTAGSRLAMSIFVALAIGATIFIWLRYINHQHPRVIDDSAITPYYGTAL